MRTVSGMFDKITSTTTSALSSTIKASDSGTNAKATTKKKDDFLEFGKLQLKFESSNSVGSSSQPFFFG
jgi:hypothetical protein